MDLGGALELWARSPQLLAVNAPAQARAAVSSPSTRPPDFPLTEKVRGGQARTAIYTNNGPLTKATLDALFPEVTRVFGEHYFSFEFALKKPDPGSYRRLLERMDVAPGQCWFIDDKRSNVTGARMAGIRGHHFRSHEQLMPEVRELGFAI